LQRQANFKIQEENLQNKERRTTPWLNQLLPIIINCSQRSLVFNHLHQNTIKRNDRA